MLLFYVKWLERVKQGKLCKYSTNASGCFWLLQTHTHYLWEVSCLSCYLMKQPKTRTTFPCKKSDPWKSSLYISHFRIPLLCYGLHLYSSLIEIHCGPATSASFKCRSQITPLWAQAGRVRKYQCFSCTLGHKVLYTQFLQLKQI